MYNAFVEMGRDPFFVEDDAMIEYLEKYARENSPYVGDEYADGT